MVDTLFPIIRPSLLQNGTCGDVTSRSAVFTWEHLGREKTGQFPHSPRVRIASTLVTAFTVVIIKVVLTNY